MQPSFAQRARTNIVRARGNSLVFVFMALLSLAWPALAGAAPSANCPSPLAMTVPHAGSASVPGIEACDGPFDGGLGFIATPPVNGTATMVPGNQDVIYAHGGNSATTDTFVVNDGDGGEVTVNVTIQAPTSSIVITPSGGLSMRVAQSFSQQFTASGGSGGYVWAAASTLPAGLGITSGGLLSGTPTQRGSVTFSLTVTDSSLDTKTQSFTLTVADPLITLTPTPVTRVQTRLTSITFTPSGGVGTYSYPTPNAPVTGTLPPGMVLTNNVLTGTPTTIGTYNFAIEVRDSSTPGNFSAQVPVQVQITAAPVVVVSPATLSNGTAGVAYSQTLTGSGGANPHTLSWTGTPPPGLSLNTTSGAVTGTPTQTGTFNFNATATDSDGFTGSRAYFVTIDAPTITLPAATLPVAARGVAYSATLPAASGGNAPYLHSVTAGALPPGLALDTNTAQLSGTPTASGTFNFTVTARDSTAGGTYTGAQSYSIVVADAPPTAGSVSATVAYGSAANPITLNITGSPATSVAVVTAPAHGTVTVSGTSIAYTPMTGYGGADTFTYTATNGAGTSSPATVSITVSPPSLNIVPSGLITARAGQPFSQVFTVTGGAAPYNVSVGGLPAGLSVTATTATTVTVSGTPTRTAVTLPLTFNVTDSNTGSGPYTASRMLVLNVDAPVLALSPAAGTLNGTYGQAYSQSFAGSGGNGAFTYSLTGTLPTGLSFNASTGVLSGTAAQVGSFAFTVRAMDETTGLGAPFSVVQNYVLAIAPSVITISPVSVPNLVVGVAYSQTLTASGGVAPYSWSLSSGTLPFGISLSSAGVLSGTPTAPLGYTVTLVATDANGVTGSRIYGISVSPPSLVLSPGPGALPQATASQPYTQSFTTTGGVAPYTYSLVSGALPVGMSFSSAGVLSGTPSVAGTFSFNVRTTDSTSVTPTTLDQTYTLTIVPPTLAVTPTTMNAVQGTAFTSTMTASGGQAPYQYSVRTGTIPAGVAISSAGVVSGTPLVAGTYTVGMRVRDTFNFQYDYDLAIAVANAVPVAVNDNASTLANQPVTIDVVGNDTGVATGVTVQAPALHGTAVVSGMDIVYTPTADFFGTDSFTYVVNGPGGTSTPATVSVVVTPVLAMSPAAGALPDATGGQTYTQTFAASSGLAPYTYSLASGSLPIGVAFSSAGVLSGTPTASGVFTFTVRATDSSATPATLAQTYTVNVAAPSLAVTPTAMSAVAGTAFNSTMTASGGRAPYQHSVRSGVIPVGVAISSAGVVSGTPTVAGTYTIAMRVRDSLGFESDYSLTIVVADARPVATNDAAATSARQAVTIDVTDNDTGIITGIAVQNGPSHGTVSLSGLDAVYTPTANFFGADSFTYVVNGPGGTSLPATVSVTVNALPVPVVQHLVATVLAGQTVAIDATAGASGGPYTAAAVAIAPNVGTIVVTGTTLAFTPPVDASGDITFAYTLTNAFGTSAPATVTVTVNPVPTAPAHHADAIAATSVQVELTDGAAGGPFTAATVLALTPAAAGTARIDASGSGANARYRLTFTAAADFNGIARIDYTLANAFATSAPGTVEVRVQSRPDPSRDPEVTGLLAAQAAAARRFATAQIGNFQQRLENLHRGQGSGGFRNSLGFSADSRCQNQPRNLPGSDCAQQALNDEAAAQEASASTDGEGRTGNAGQIGIWTGGAINRGDRDATTEGGGFDFETSGISAGADYRVNRAFAIGAGLGYGRDDSDVGHDGTRSESDSYSVAMYASYHPGEVFFLDGLFGYQWLSYDLRRHVTATDGQVLGERDGTQWFGSISLGAELRRDRLQVAPYARWDVARATLDGYTETGDDVYALRYADQDVNSSTGNLGLRIDYRIPTTFGSVAPQFRFEYQHDFEDDGSATISYADMLSGPFYRAGVKGLERNRFVFGVGAVLQTERDFSLRVEYRGLFQSNNDSDHGVLFNFEKKY